MAAPPTVRGIVRLEGPLFIGRLPDGWYKKLSLETISRVLDIESKADAGELYLSGKDHKGYRWVRLCKGHPFATHTGWQRLHRYLMMRVVGRRLSRFEHVHHVTNDKATTNLRELKVMDSDEHGYDHYRERCRCQFVLWSPRDSYGRFTPMPTGESLAKARGEY